MPLDDWRWNLEQLAKRFHVFTGRLIFAVATEQGLTPYDEVCSYIQDLYKTAQGTKLLEFFPVKNNGLLGEMQSFPTLLRAASKFDRNSVTTYCHGKGVSRKGGPAVTLWADAMYKFLLDDIDKVDELLNTYPIVGSFKRRGKFIGFPKTNLYHYSGSFFTVRNKDLFSRRWTQIYKTYYGTEAYPSLLFKDGEAGVIFGDGVGDLYRWEYISKLLSEIPYFAKFIAENNELGMHFDLERKKLRKV